MNRQRYEKIVKLLASDNPDSRQRKFYYKDYLLEHPTGAGLYYFNHYLLDYDDLIRTLIMLDVLISDSFTKSCFTKKEVPFIHSEIFRDGYF